MDSNITTSTASTYRSEIGSRIVFPCVPNFASVRSEIGYNCIYCVRTCVKGHGNILWTPIPWRCWYLRVDIKAMAVSLVMRNSNSPAPLTATHTNLVLRGVYYVWLIRLISVVGSTDLRKCEWIAKKSSPNVKRRTATAIAPHENHSHIRGLPSQDIFTTAFGMGRVNPKP